MIKVFLFILVKIFVKYQSQNNLSLSTSLFSPTNKNGVPGGKNKQSTASLVHKKLQSASPRDNHPTTEHTLKHTMDTVPSQLVIEMIT